MIGAWSIELCVALGLSAIGWLSPTWLPLAVLAGALGLLARLGAVPLSPRISLVVLGGVGLGAGIAGVSGAVRVEDVVTAGLVLLQLQRRITRGRRGAAADDRVSLVLSGLMLVVTAGRTPELDLLLVVVPWALALPLALLPQRIPAPGPTLMGLGLGAHLVVSVVFFVLLPRGAVPPEPPTGKLTGFAPDVALGSLDALLDDPTIAFRAEVSGDLPERVYWRGLALDGFDGRRWYSTTRPVPVQLQGSAAGVIVKVSPTGPSDGVLFLPGRALSVQTTAPVRGDRQGGWFVAPPRSADAYTVVVEPAAAGATFAFEPSVDRGQWLQLPAMDPAVSDLARRVAGDGPAEEQVARLRDWLLSEVEYTRTAGDHGERPIEDFLLRRPEGHCEFVAAGLAVLARSVGIGARVVNGFAGGQRDPISGAWVVRRQHAHSWTEVLLEDQWVLIDATPRAATVAPVSWSTAAQGFWEGSVVTYDGPAQRRGLAALLRGLALGARDTAAQGWVGLLVALAVVGIGGAGAVWLWRVVVGAVRGPPSVPAGVAGPLGRARRAMVGAGYSFPAASPPVEAARRLRGTAPDAAVDALERLAWLHYEAVFGGVSGAAVRTRARALADAVEAALEPATPPRPGDRRGP